MTHPLIRAIELIAVAGTIGSLVYYALCIWSAVAFLRRRRGADKNATQALPVSILKPLKGVDPQMFECLRSHCLQNYPADYEIIFGVNDAGDPAIELVKKLQAEFPSREIRLIVCKENLGSNIKVSNLVQMLPHAGFDLLVVNDSDIQVDPEYLRKVSAPLADADVGLVTCLYRGTAYDSLSSRLESLGISTDFCAGVLVAQQLEGISFGLGSTLAFRRRDLQTIGGFESLVDYLADDYQLGNRIARLGLKVELADTVVETHLPGYTIRGFVDHQMRWARTLRESRFWGYAGMGITFGVGWSALTVLASGLAGWSWGLLAATWGMRAVAALAVGKWVLRDSQVGRRLALIPLRDLIAAGVWLFSFSGHTVKWRGELFRLHDGKLIRTTPR